MWLQQIMATFCLGFMGFSSISFWLALYLQNVKHYSALEITAQLLPMVVSGVLVNVICGLILHKISNKVLMGIGALSYTASFLILSFMKEDATYWRYIFPALVLVVVGADIQFNVANVSRQPVYVNTPKRVLTRSSTRCMSCLRFHRQSSP